MTKYRRARRGFWIEAAKTVATQILVTVGVVAVTEMVHKDRIDESTQTTQNLEAKLAKMHQVNVCKMD